MSTRCCIATLVVCLAIGVTPVPHVSASQSQPLKIVIVSGEDAVNIIQQRTAVAPVVEVRDRNNQPVAGAVVTFSIQGGKATFAGAQTLSVTTNAVGQAAVTSLTPTSAGAVQINVAAAFQGQTATAAITQTNFVTAAQAASAGSGASSGGASGAGGGGGGIGAGTITAITVAAAGAVGGYIGYQKHVQGDAPVVESVTAIPPIGLQGATPITVLHGASWHGEGATIAADWGDGAVTTGSADQGEVVTPHVYQAAGTFTIRLTLTDAWERASSGQTSVTIRSFTGRWNLGTTGSFFTLTQSGGSLSGSFTAASGSGSGSVTGTVRGQTLGDNTPNIQLIVSPSSGGAASTYSGLSAFNGDTITGTFSSGGTTISAPLQRQ